MLLCRICQVWIIVSRFIVFFWQIDHVLEKGMSLFPQTLMIKISYRLCICYLFMMITYTYFFVSYCLICMICQVWIIVSRFIVFFYRRKVCLFSLKTLMIKIWYHVCICWFFCSFLQVVHRFCRLVSWETMVKPGFLKNLEVKRQIIRLASWTNKGYWTW